jgi:hypothetical protein
MIRITVVNSGLGRLGQYATGGGSVYVVPLLKPQPPLQILVLQLEVPDLLLELVVLPRKVHHLAVELHAFPFALLVLAHVLLSVDPLGRVEGVHQVVQLGLDVPGHLELGMAARGPPQGLLDFPELVLEGAAYLQPQRLEHVPVV